MELTHVGDFRMGAVLALLDPERKTILPLYDAMISWTLYFAARCAAWRILATSSGLATQGDGPRPLRTEDLDRWRMAAETGVVMAMDTKSQWHTDATTLCDVVWVTQQLASALPKDDVSPVVRLIEYIVPVVAPGHAKLKIEDVSWEVQFVREAYKLYGKVDDFLGRPTLQLLDLASVLMRGERTAEEAKLVRRLRRRLEQGTTTEQYSGRLDGVFAEVFGFVPPQANIMPLASQPYGRMRNITRLRLLTQK